VEPFFTVQSLLTPHSVEKKRLWVCVRTVPGSRIFTDECIRSSVSDIDNFTLCLRPNHFGECRTEIIDALVQIGSHRTKCRDVEVVENLDKRIGEFLTVRLRSHIHR